MTLLGLCITISLLLSVSFLGYVTLIVVPFVRHRPGRAGDPDGFELHFLVPCRDEEAVIGATVEDLRRRFGDAHVWVVDDHSGDRTGEIVGRLAAADLAVHVVRRRLPDARTGKAEALNAAYRALDEWVGHEAARDRDRVLVCVIDADGRPSSNLLEVCASEELFADADVGAAQVEVRMSNVAEPGATAARRGRLLVRLQDLEFRGPISAMQLARRSARTVAMGGNGQISRLSALDSIAGSRGRPWRGSLLEDFELGLHILLAGWRTAYTTDAWVVQEGLPELRRYLTQRVRWAQGAMQCMRYLPRVWRSRRISNLGALEISYYLFQPWLQILGSIVYPIPVVVFLHNWWYYPDGVHEFLANGGAVLLAVYAVIGVSEFAIWGFLYRSRAAPSAPRRVALGWGLAFAALVACVYVIAWRALARLAVGRSTWSKTRRNAEDLRLGPVAVEA
jgi:1,2-diacylglycerol 3-beta-glucosyltransferase